MIVQLCNELTAPLLTISWPFAITRRCNHACPTLRLLHQVLVKTAVLCNKSIQHTSIHHVQRSLLAGLLQRFVMYFETTLKLSLQQFIEIQTEIDRAKLLYQKCTFIKRITLSSERRTTASDFIYVKPQSQAIFVVRKYLLQYLLKHAKVKSCILL